MSTNVASVLQPLEPDDPREIADYRLLARVGEGGFGTVYLSRSRGGRPVALKLIRRQYAQDESFRARFAQEVGAASRVRGYHLVSVVDYAVTVRQPWLASEFVTGVRLDEALRLYGPLPLPAVFQLVGCTALALTEIHKADVVHRDLKPANLMLAADGPFVIDFGIARAADETQLTTTGGLIGTPHYMSPEHALGRQVGPASDLFSLGLIAAVAATGQHPYGAGGGLTLAAQIANTAHQPPDLTGYPDALRPLLERCLTDSPEERITAPEVQELCEKELDRPLRDFADWLPTPLMEAISQRAREIEQADVDVSDRDATWPSPPSGGPSTLWSGLRTVSARSRPTTRVTAPPPEDAPENEPSGAGARGKWRYLATIAVALAVVVFVVGSVVESYLSRPTTSGDTSDTDTGASREKKPAEARHGGDDGEGEGKDKGAEDKPAAPRYEVVFKDKPFQLRVPASWRVRVDFDQPRVSSRQQEVAAADAEMDVDSENGWTFYTETGVADEGTPAACLEGAQANVLPSMRFPAVKKHLTVGTRLCTVTSEGNLAMLTITEQSPAIADASSDKVDIAGELTVWKQRA